MGSRTVVLDLCAVFIAVKFPLNLLVANARAFYRGSSPQYLMRTYHPTFYFLHPKGISRDAIFLPLRWESRRPSASPTSSPAVLLEHHEPRLVHIVIALSILGKPSRLFPPMLPRLATCSRSALPVFRRLCASGLATTSHARQQISLAQTDLLSANIILTTQRPLAATWLNRAPPFARSFHMSAGMLTHTQLHRRRGIELIHSLAAWSHRPT